MSRRLKTVIVNDKMQRGYRYILTAPVGRNFDPEFLPELTPKEMLALGIFCGKYMTDCRREFTASWFARAKLAPSRRDARSIISVSTPASHYRCGARRAGFIRMIRAAGFSGIAATTWAVGHQTRTRRRSNAGRRFGGTSRRSNITVSQAIRCAGRVSGKRCCIGLTTVEKFEALQSRSGSTACKQMRRR
jgi:hypothetical protein